MQHIETIELSSSQSSITFSSIPQDYDDLIVLISARSSGSSTRGFLYPNGSTSNMTNVSLFGTGSNAESETNSFEFQIQPSGGLPAETFGNGEIYISNYTVAQSKSLSATTVTENNGTEAYQSMAANSWANNAAITSIEIEFNGGSVVSNSTFSLYGVTAGGDGTVSTA